MDTTHTHATNVLKTTTPTNPADARLIAAAPDLLAQRDELAAALAACLPDLQHYAATHGPGPDKRLETARAALAKVKR